MCSGRIAWSFMRSAILLPGLPPNRINFHGVTTLLVPLTRCFSRRRGGEVTLPRTGRPLSPESLVWRPEVAREASLICCCRP